MVESTNSSKDKQKTAITIDDFEFYKQVGEGAFGQVYLANEKATGDFVAIKQLNKQDLIKKEKTEAVMREKDILKHLLGKPFIIPLRMTFMDHDSLYFVFEHCRYGTLSTLIDEKGRLEPDLCVFYAAEVLEGLKNVHEAKIMHRDLKPENLLIDEKKHLKMIDFGDAKEFTDEIYDYVFEYEDPYAPASESEEEKEVKEEPKPEKADAEPQVDAANFAEYGAEVQFDYGMEEARAS